MKDPKKEVGSNPKKHGSNPKFGHLKLAYWKKIVV